MQRERGFVNPNITWQTSKHLFSWASSGEWEKGKVVGLEFQTFSSAELKMFGYTMCFSSAPVPEMWAVVSHAWHAHSFITSTYFSPQGGTGA